MAENLVGGVRGSSPWLNNGDNAWQMTAATLVGLQSMPGLVILYASIVKKKWAVNSAFMALYAFAAVLICWVLLDFRIAFGDELLPFWGKGAPALGQKYVRVIYSGSDPLFSSTEYLWVQVFDGTRHLTGKHATLLKRHRGDGDEQAVFPDGDACLLSVHVCCNYYDFAGGFGVGSDEYKSVDGVCAAVVDFLLHRRRLQSMGRRLSLPLGGH